MTYLERNFEIDSRLLRLGRFEIHEIRLVPNGLAVYRSREKRACEAAICEALAALRPDPNSFYYFDREEGRLRPGPLWLRNGGDRAWVRCARQRRCHAVLTR
jgi:hypothetical protein